MMNIADLTKEKNTIAIWRQAFRPLFLFGSMYAVFAVITWALILAGQLNIAPYGGITFWHAHEMLFGFVMAIIVGFLLTAVQNWTGLRATHGKALVSLVALWLSGRLVLLFNLIDEKWLIATIDISFILYAAALFSILLLRAKQYKNLMFVSILLLLAFCNLLTHLSIVLADTQLYFRGLYGAVFLVTLMMTIVAGRVFPMFTANGTQTQKINNAPLLEKLVVGFTIVLVIIYMGNFHKEIPRYAMTILFAITAIFHSIRALRWRPYVTVKTPLVWSLHLSYWFIPASFGLFSLHFWGANITSSNALHGLTAGAMSSLILAMISRISLGHTGRALTPHWLMKYAFILILFSGTVRILATSKPFLLNVNPLVLAAMLWALAYSIFVVIYFKVLVTPRPDGNLG